MTLSDSVRLADFYNVFRPELHASFQGRADVEVSLDMRFYDFASREATAGSNDADGHFPSTLTVWEAFARLLGFVLEPLDLTIGKQRIQWGTADGLNPTDRFNAYDLSDLTDFTARTPTWAARAEYYLNDIWRVDAVWTPTAHGPLLPVGMDGVSAFGGQATGVASWQQHFARPAQRLGNGQYGVRVAGSLAGLDVSASYFDGFDGMPAVGRLAIIAQDSLADSPVYDGHVWSGLPRLRVLGADVAGELRGVGIWGEGGIAFPGKLEVGSDAPVDGEPVDTRPFDRPYATWTVGGDYTLTGGFYLNLQWAHGVFFERGTDRLHDYLVFKLRQKLRRESVVLSLEGAVEGAQWPVRGDNVGLVILPEIRYEPIDNIEVSLGALVVDGRDPTLFGQWGRADQVFLRVKASF